MKTLDITPVVPSFSIGDTELELLCAKQEDLASVSRNYQAFLFLLIETCSFIEGDDFWEYYLLVTKNEKRVQGIATLYTSYIRKDLSRIRVS